MCQSTARKPWFNNDEFGLVKLSALLQSILLYLRDFPVFQVGRNPGLKDRIKQFFKESQSIAEDLGKEDVHPGRFKETNRLGRQVCEDLIGIFNSWIAGSPEHFGRIIDRIESTIPNRATWKDNKNGVLGAFDEFRNAVETFIAPGERHIDQFLGDELDRVRSAYEAMTSLLGPLLEEVKEVEEEEREEERKKAVLEARERILSVNSALSNMLDGF